jgi:ketosteroid isomerase-like protein
MSQENLQPVRMPLALRADSHRRLEERLSVRFPGVVALGTRAIRLLPPRSWLRQKVLRRVARVYLEAYNRKDFESTYSLYRPDSESILPHQLVEVGFEPVARGRQAVVGVQRRWHADWGEFRIEPEEVIDLDGRVLLLGRIRGSGLSSGAGIDTEWGNLATFAAGRIVREQFFFDRAEALKAVGLTE